MKGRLDVLYQGIRPDNIVIDNERDSVVERFNFRQGTVTFDTITEDSFLVDEREYTVAEYIASIHETKMWMEDSITRMESLINSVETNINEIRTSLNMPIIPLV